MWKRLHGYDLFWICLVYLFLKQKMHLIDAVGTSIGKEFLISTPSTMSPPDLTGSYPRLVLIMESTFRSTVTVKTEWLDSVLFVNDTLQLMPLVPRYFYKKQVYFGSDLASGYRWTYHLEGTHPFAVLVSMENGARTAETLTPLPLNAWDTVYYATTLDKHVSVILTANGDTTVFVTLRSHRMSLKITVEGVSYQNNQVFQIHLQTYQSFAFGTCGEDQSHGEITGSRFIGTEPFVMVTGNCWGETQGDNCPKINETKYPIAEMLLPTKTWGRYFLMFKAIGRSAPGFHVVLASTDETPCAIFKSGASRDFFMLWKEGDWYVSTSEFKWLECYYPVQLVYFQNSTCGLGGRGMDIGGPSMMVIVSVQLFYNIYICMVPDVLMQHYMTIVSSKLKGNDIRNISIVHTYNESPIIHDGRDFHQSDDNSFPTKLWGLLEMYPFHLRPNVTFLLYSNTARFWCFLHGVSQVASYMHAAGFVSSNINAKMCEMDHAYSMKAEDLKDNDCDSFVDEELLNGKDDDADNQIDEDLGPINYSRNIINEYMPEKPMNIVDCAFTEPIYFTSPKPFQMTTSSTSVVKTVNPNTTARNVNSTIDDIVYFAWTNWHCPRGCNDQNEIRERFCRNNESAVNCKQQVETRNSTCTSSADCPTSYADCEDYSWGVDCRNNCKNCALPCDKRTGVCLMCRRGFHKPQESCSEACSKYSYGQDCTGKCLEKCQDDCTERVFGTCPTSPDGAHFFFFLFMLLVPSAAMALFIFNSQKRGSDSSTQAFPFSENQFFKSLPSKSYTSQTTAKSQASIATAKSQKDTTIPKPAQPPIKAKEASSRTLSAISKFVKATPSLKSNFIARKTARPTRHADEKVITKFVKTSLTSSVDLPRGSKVASTKSLNPSNSKQSTRKHTKSISSIIRPTKSKISIRRLTKSIGPDAKAKKSAISIGPSSKSMTNVHKSAKSLNSFASSTSKLAQSDTGTMGPGESTVDRDPTDVSPRPVKNIKERMLTYFQF
ncbi:uncharacterized protein LOC106050639 [Biomphalaria glabrata]|uniref:Uncharacterized protein LOC106050639 n=1 Tax=Biomphalaria glabrata TaxID=6526 RepID=A0A9W2ZEY4_BIOGL|nr:uncharacterized protein LOC106050639 [Biomphalaria glabrata]